MSQRGQMDAGRVSHAFDALRATLLSWVGIGFFTACSLAAAALCRLAKVHADLGFVEWNLLLAWTPLILAYVLSWASERGAARAALPVLAAAWIVFLPNAPYLVTDLVHLRENGNLPNAVTLSLLAITGLLIGVKSLQLVQCAVERALGPAAGWRVVRAIAILTAFGVYLGRVKRWNSWTLVSNPSQMAHALQHAPTALRHVGMALLGTIAFAVAFYLTYRALTGSSGEAPRLTAARRGAEG
jgi:uncharacterized membrane protein